jgi:hypothetical protein
MTGVLGETAQQLSPQLELGTRRCAPAVDALSHPALSLCADCDSERRVRIDFSCSFSTRMCDVNLCACARHAKRKRLVSATSPREAGERLGLGTLTPGVRERALKGAVVAAAAGCSGCRCVLCRRGAGAARQGTRPPAPQRTDRALARPSGQRTVAGPYGLKSRSTRATKSGLRCGLPCATGKPLWSNSSGRGRSMLAVVPRLGSLRASR